MSRDPCCSVAYTWCDKQDHIPGGPLWLVSWLPKGYAPTLDDRVICAFFDTDGRWGDYSVKNPPPLIQAVMDAIDRHVRANPGDIAGDPRNRRDAHS